MTQRRLLTLAVPTYNRASHLEQLLTSLQSELAGLAEQVEVIVGDNCSTDRTPEVTAAFARAYPNARIIRQDENIGPERNFCVALEAARGEHFWIVGDDDLPKQGTIRQIVQILASQAPDLLFLQSEWVERIDSAEQGQRLSPLQARSLSNLAMARQLHVWFTFISSVIIRREVFLAHSGLAQARQSVGTSLVQLSWVFTVLEHGRRFALIDQPCVLATSANSGGYKVLTTFGAYFPQLTQRLLAGRPDLAQAIRRRSALCFLPGLIWHTRFDFVGDFEQEDPWPEIRRALGGLPEYWLLLWPLGHAPRWLARQFLRLARGVAAGMRRVDQLGAGRTAP